MNRFKLTPQAYKKLLALSESLPIMQRRDKNGELLRRAITKFIDTDGYSKGVPIYTKNTQKGTDPILVNHMVNLIEIYQKDGDVGVDVYVKHFKDMVKA